MNTSELDIQHVKGQIINKMKHTYLNKHLPKPVIDDEKIILLSAIIDNRPMSSFHKERYIVTTMLVQAALDTHDTVPVSNNKENKETKVSRQLKVLAGDYFSGLYYLLLSEIEDISFTHHLASAIKEINEYKMKLYYKEMNSFEDYIYIKNKIESLLVSRVADFLGEETIKLISEDWILIHQLLKEKKSINNKDMSTVYDAGVIKNNNSADLSPLVDMKLEESILRVRDYLEKNTNYPVFLKQHIDKSLQNNQIITPYVWKKDKYERTIKRRTCSSRF
ncbi:heptaprenyl diphosphate synthase component 1 [Virgibacillus oceani]